MNPQVIHATTFVRSIRGRSHPSLVQCDDGGLYVLKITGAGPGANSLANEMMGSALAAWLGLRTPSVVGITLSPDFIAENGAVLSRPGIRGADVQSLHFGRAYVGGTVGWERCVWYLTQHSSGSIEEVWARVGVQLLHLWGDSREIAHIAYTQRSGQRRFEPTILGFSQMFGGPGWEFRNPSSLWIEELTALCVSTPPEIMKGWALKLKRCVPSALQRILPNVPGNWFNGDMGGLESTLLSRLDRLTEEILAA